MFQFGSCMSLTSLLQWLKYPNTHHCRTKWPCWNLFGTSRIKWVTEQTGIIKFIWFQLQNLWKFFWLHKCQFQSLPAAWDWLTRHYSQIHCEMGGHAGLRNFQCPTKCSWACTGCHILEGTDILVDRNMKWRRKALLGSNWTFGKPFTIMHKQQKKGRDAIWQVTFQFTSIQERVLNDHIDGLE